MAVPTDIQQQVFELLNRTSGLSFVSADHEPAAELGLVPGQRVAAEVVSLLAEQRVQVQVGTARFNLALPMATRLGQTLEMTFVSAEPRTTFAIARPGGAPPQVSLSDASRLLALLVDNEQLANPQLRSSLQSVGNLLRSSAGEAGVLANLMDEALVYSARQEPAPHPGAATTPPLPRGGAAATPDQARLTAFESSAAQILQQIARNSRFLLSEAANPPLAPLPLSPGQEVDAAVQGTLPGGRAFVLVAGTTLELQIPRPVQAGDILRLTYIAGQPKPLFALPRALPEMVTGSLSDAGRWLSALEHTAGGVPTQQLQVLERLSTVLKSLPPDSPVLTVLRDEAGTYQGLLTRTGNQRPGPSDVSTAASQIPQPMPQSESSEILQPIPQQASQQVPLQVPLQAGNGIALSDDLTRLLQALVKGTRLALVEAHNQPPLSVDLLPGQQLRGEVLIQGDGRLAVRVADQLLEFSLPRGIQRGDLLTLFFIAADPRPTFLLVRINGGGAARVSETGRWLSSLSTAPGRAPEVQLPGILQTLLSGPPTDAGQVDVLLRRGMANTGMFYESHLARWFEGDYPLDQLLREPQGRLSSRHQLENPTPGTLTEAVPEEGAPRDLRGLEAAFRKASGNDTPAAVDNRALPVVHEQLEALQSGQLLFRGELFPGQQMEWSVREREARRNDSGGRERSWDTSLRVDLPRLGQVTARLRLDGMRVSVDLESAEASSATLLDNGRGRLTEQLEAAGLVVGEIGVRHETG